MNDLIGKGIVLTTGLPGSRPNAEAQKCDATREHSICGYYVEFEEPEGENPIKFAHQVTLDMGRFREFCQSSNQPAG